MVLHLSPAARELGLLAAIPRHGAASRPAAFGPSTPRLGRNWRLEPFHHRPNESEASWAEESSGSAEWEAPPSPLPVNEEEADNYDQDMRGEARL